MQNDRDEAAANNVDGGRHISVRRLDVYTNCPSGQGGHLGWPARYRPNGVEALAALRYILEVSETPLTIVHQIARQLGPGAEEALMTGEQILLGRRRLEGEAKGRVEGEAKGRAAVLRRLLEKKFGAVPTHILTRLESASIQDLDQWAEHLLSATSLDELFRS